MPNVTVLDDLLSDAIHVIEEYHKYAEAMRAIGRGFHPTGLRGHSVEDVLAVLRNRRNVEKEAPHA